MAKPPTPEEVWRGYLNGTHPGLKWERRIWKVLPSPPRCKLCNSPFGAPGGLLIRVIGKARSPKNPNYCNMCSTPLAERMAALEFSRLMNRFYAVANRILIDSDALVDKLVGDEVIRLYLPYVRNHAARAVQAGHHLLHATGHAHSEGPWLPVGVGVHTGVAYVGTVGTQDTVQDVTALGDNVNVAARLAGVAAAGEILISDAAVAAARGAEEGYGLDLSTGEHRDLTLKGRTEPVGVRVLRVAAV